MPSDGIALANDGERLYYCEISREILWSVPTALLADWALSNEDIGAGVINHGVKGFSDGLAVDEFGRLYYGNVAESAVYQWDTSMPLESAVPIASNNRTMQWPDTFAFDRQGNLVFVSNKLQLFAFGGMDFRGGDGSNFRIWSVDVGADSYLSKRPVPEEAPCLP